MKTVVRWWTPHHWRKAFWLSFLGVMVWPLEDLQKKFIRFIAGIRYQLLITPQVCYLEKMLNDRFDFTARGIFIEDSISHSPLFIFRRDELKPKYIYRRSEAKPVYIYTRAETDFIEDRFVVWVPYAVGFNVDEMSSLIKIYKLAGMKFTIQRF